MSFDSVSYLAGPGPVGMGLTLPINSPTKKTKKNEFVSWGPGLLMPKLIFSLPDELHQYNTPLSLAAKEAMMADSTVAASVGSLKLGILDGGISLTATHPMPALAAKVGGGKPKARGKPKAKAKGETANEGDDVPETPDAPQASPDQEASKLALEWCQRTHDRLGEELIAELYAMLDCMCVGVKLAEVTCEVPTDGEDAGKLVISKFKTRANRAWRFMVDAWLNVRAILTWNPTTAQFELVDTSKFVWMTWMPKDSDPRGTSLLAAAVTAWNLKVQLWPIAYNHALRFGSPGIDIEMAEDDKEPRQPLDDDGNEIPEGQADPISATAYQIQAASNYKSGGTIVHPFGSKVGVFESKSQGEAIRELINLCNREIATAIEFQAKVQMEAQHSSKAEGGVGQDTKGLLHSYGRTLAASVVRRMHRDNLADNFGKDFADRYTPMVSFGDSDKTDQPAQITAMASAGWSVGPSQFPEIDAMLGLPVRDPEEDARHAAESLQRQTEAAIQVRGNDAKDGPIPAKGGGKP